MTTAPDPRTPPAPARRPTVLESHGDRRIDDWFWLRQRDDPEVIEHLRAENAYTEAVLAPLAALRQRLFDEMVARIEETDLSVPVRRGPWWYYSRTEEGRNYPVHCRRPAAEGYDPPSDQADGTVADEQVLLDENLEAGGHDYFAVGVLSVSPDHRWLALATDTSGAEKFDLVFRPLGDEAAAPAATETVSGVYYGLAWANDSSSVFYTRVDEAMRPYQVWRHVLGQDPSTDVLVREEADRRFNVGVGRTKDDAFVVIGAESSTTSESWVVPADEPSTPPRLVAGRRPGVEYAVEHHPAAGGTFLLLTNDGAEDFRLVSAPEATPGPEHWTPVLAHRPGSRLEDLDVFDRWLVVGERTGGEARIRIVPLPEDPAPDAPFGDDPLSSSWLLDTADHPATTWVGANPELSSPLVRYGETSLVSPSAVLDLDVASATPILRKRQPVLGGYRPDDYRTSRLWATAEDGTKVPLSIVHRADLLEPGAAPGSAPATPAPCLLYGYGAYEHSVDPMFSSLRLSLLDRGFVFAIAHVRGGGELGRPWYEDGKLMAKPHSFSDFVACARFLVDAGFTTSERLVARGASAGGLLMGAVANLWPEGFRAVVAEVPFVDCLTTMLDDSLPLTVGEWEEWGNPAADAEAYAVMKSYSPYDNIRPVDAGRDAGALPRPPGHGGPQRPPGRLLGTGQVGGQAAGGQPGQPGAPQDRARGRSRWAFRSLRRLAGRGDGGVVRPRRRRPGLSNGRRDLGPIGGVGQVVGGLKVMVKGTP